MPSLYQLNERMIRVGMLLEESCGELTPEIEAELNDLEETLPRKVEACCKFIRECEGAIDLYKSEIKRISDRQKSLEKSIKTIKDNILNSMRIQNIKKIDAGTFSVNRQNTKAIVTINDETKLMPQYLKAKLDLPASEVPKSLLGRAKLDPDKTAIYEAIQNGGTVIGAELTPNECLRIK